MACRMECKTLVYSRRFCPWFDKNIDHCRGRQVEHIVIRSFVPTCRHPLQRFRGKREINRFFGFLHGNRQTVLSTVNEYIFPLQLDYITDSQTAETREQIGTFHGFIFHRGCDQCTHLFNGHV